MKPRIVVDTKVLLSGIFFEHGNEAHILRLILENSARLVVSLETLEELREALSRPKFKLSPDESLAVFRIVLAKIEIMLNVQEAAIKCRDRDDQKFLDCAHAAKADYLITGDRDLLDLGRVGRTKVVRVAQLLRELRNNPLFRLKPVRFKQKIRLSEIDRFLYHAK